MHATLPSEHRPGIRRPVKRVARIALSQIPFTAFSQPGYQSCSGPTLTLSGRPPAGFACLRPPLMSNVGPQRSESWHLPAKPRRGMRSVARAKLASGLVGSHGRLLRHRRTQCTPRCPSSTGRGPATRQTRGLKGSFAATTYRMRPNPPPVAPWPNPYIERTSSSRLRLLAATAHVKR